MWVSSGSTTGRIGDGYRVLIDHVWPRGVSRERARLDDWARELAPSDELRRWFAHDPARFDEFRARYRGELVDSATGFWNWRVAHGSAPSRSCCGARPRTQQRCGLRRAGPRSGCVRPGCEGRHRYMTVAAARDAAGLASVREPWRSARHTLGALPRAGASRLKPFSGADDDGPARQHACRPALVLGARRAIALAVQAWASHPKRSGDRARWQRTAPTAIVPVCPRSGPFGP